MWTPPKPPPIFPEPTSGGFIPSQNLLMAHSIAFPNWPPPVPFHPLPYSQCSSATPCQFPHLPTSITLFAGLCRSTCCFPFLALGNHTCTSSLSSELPVFIHQSSLSLAQQSALTCFMATTIFLFLIFIYLVAPCLSCSMQDLLVGA